MIHSFNSWSKLTESIAKGKDVLIDPSTGKKHKVVYKVQGGGKFILKLINEPDVIDTTNKLTPSGIAMIKNYLNEEDPFTMSIGQLTPAFFKDKFIVYTILKDGELFGRTKQKIQFAIQRRLADDGSPKYPNIPITVEFIDADSFIKIEAQQAQPIVQNIIDTGNQTVLPDPVPDQEQNTSTQEPITNTETAQEKTRKFLYTMRTNSKLYLMEFTADGTLSAKTKDGSDPNGIVSYDKTNKKVMWSTTLDDTSSKDTKISKEKGAPLFYDSEITQSQDKTFLEKIFTDDAFRKKILEEYEREYGSSELTPENLRNMLFYKDGSPIFGAISQALPGETGSADLKKMQDELSTKLSSLQQRAMNPIN